MPPEPPRSLRLWRLAVPPALAAYFDNSSIYFRTFWQPWTMHITECKEGQFYSFRFGQTVASMYNSESHFH